MSFVETSFLVFLSVVFCLYHMGSFSLRVQNFLIFISSLYFYAWWDWRFLGLILATITAGYVAGMLLEKDYHRKLVLITSITFLLSILAYFKYANFFLESLESIVNALGFRFSLASWKIILPVGISFYTFQVISYLVDVDRKLVSAERSFITFGAFVCFFPQLVAGPIERASHLLAQFNQKRQLDEQKVRQAIFLIILGYFFKVGIADVVAPSVDAAFIVQQPSGWWTLLGTYGFAIQIYGDFLGYSLIAKGVALLFGIELIWNFNFPYWSTSIVEFWRRWHVSLSNWLRDYLYFSLGGSRSSLSATIRNLLITMVLGGLWHGASWAFVIWGLLHGVALAINHLQRAYSVPWIGNKVSGWLATCLIVYAGWFLFRVRSMEQARDMILALGNLEWYPAHTGVAITLATLSLVIWGIEYMQIRSDDRYWLINCNRFLSVILLSFIVTYTWIMHGFSETKFIYFQF